VAALAEGKVLPLAWQAPSMARLTCGKHRAGSRGSGNLLLPASSWQDASATLMMDLADVILASSASPRQGRKR